jgi:hypothetical protein
MRLVLAFLEFPLLTHDNRAPPIEARVRQSCTRLSTELLYRARDRTQIELFLGAGG